MNPHASTSGAAPAAPAHAAWGAVFAMALGAFALVAAEFMPVSLLTPVGSFLGGVIGWRGAFFCLVPVAAVALAWKWLSLPALPSQGGASLGAVFRLLRRPAIALGMVGVGLFFMGQFALYTYLRPFLETVTHAGVTTLSLLLLLLLLVGVAGFVGTTLIGGFLKDHMYRTLAIIPLLMALIAGGLLAWGASLAATALLLCLWGLVATAAPVGWWTWLANSLPREAESGGGLMVATVQLAIAGGATLGGLLFDTRGHAATFSRSAGILFLAALFAALASRAARAGAH